MRNRLNERLDDLIAYSGLPGFVAGATTFVVGNTITEFTGNSSPDASSVHNTLGLGASGVSALVAMGIVAEIRKRRYLAEQDNLQSEIS
ncbi:MAG TPA: hypothetical protein VMT23_03380 [Candidatus Binatia bacterium]|nr:hypothetical protein [Candidatus Binatia bacterium]